MYKTNNQSPVGARHARECDAVQFAPRRRSYNDASTASRTRPAGARHARDRDALQVAPARRSYNDTATASRTRPAGARHARECDAVEIPAPLWNRALTALLVVLVGGAALAQEQPVPVVQVAEVARAEVSPTVAVPGTIYSRNEAQITARVAGMLTWVAEPGTVVEAGEPVARIDDAALLLQRAEQEALLERAQINIRQLSSQLRRQRELQSDQLVSEFELEQTEANRDLAVSDAKITRVRIRQIDEQIRRAQVLAPFPGVVVSRVRRAGEDVARGEVLGQLTDIRALEVRAFVPLKHLARTVVGQALSVFASDAQHTGTIRALVPTGDVRSQTFEALIDLPVDATASWTVGQLVSVGVPIRGKSETLAVPRDALVLRANGSFVFRINEQNQAEQVEVSLGDSAGELIAVSGDLAEGDRVAIRGAENLREGSPVRIMVARSDA